MIQQGPIYGAQNPQAGTVVQVPIASPGLTLPEGNSAYAIYYVPINQEDKTGARGVIENLTKESGISADIRKTQDSDPLDQRREYLKALDYSQKTYSSLDYNPLEDMQMTYRLHNPQPGYGSGKNKPSYARSQGQGSIFHKYSAREQRTSTVDLPRTTLSDVKANIMIDTGMEVSLNVDSDQVIAELMRKIVDQLGPISEDQKDQYLTDYGLFYGEMKLDFLKKLKEYGIVGKPVDLTFKLVKKREQGQTGGKREESMASTSLVPHLSMPGYQTEPKYHEICRMSEKELSEVENFAIRNQYGRVQFLGKTDLRGLNLDKIILIEWCKVEIYPDNSDKPPVGQCLNKSATITFYQYNLRDKKNFEQWLARFKSKAIQTGAEYVGHDFGEDSITIQVEGNDS